MGMNHTGMSVRKKRVMAGMVVVGFSATLVNGVFSMPAWAGVGMVLATSAFFASVRKSWSGTFTDVGALLVNVFMFLVGVGSALGLSGVLEAVTVGIGLFGCFLFCASLLFLD